MAAKKSSKPKRKPGVHVRGNRITGSENRLTDKAIKILAAIKFSPTSISREDIMEKTSLTREDVERNVKLLLATKLILSGTKFPPYPQQGWRVYTDPIKHDWIINYLKEHGIEDPRAVRTRGMLGQYYPTGLELEGLGPQPNNHRSYTPGHPIIPELKFRPEAAAVMVKFRDEKKPFQPKEYSPEAVEAKKEKWKWFVEQMSAAYQIPVPTVRFGIFTPDSWKEAGSSGSSNYNQIDHSLTFMGKFSLITLLHEFGHARGFDETDAIIWSTNIGMRYFPITVNRLLQQSEDGTHMLTRNDADPEFRG